MTSGTGEAAVESRNVGFVVVVVVAAVVVVVVVVAAAADDEAMVVGPAVVTSGALKPRKRVLETSVRPGGLQEAASSHSLNDSGMSLEMHYR